METKYPPGLEWLSDWRDPGRYLPSKRNKRNTMGRGIFGAESDVSGGS